jgi:hypothetical protein
VIGDEKEIEQSNESHQRVNLFIIGINKAGTSWLHYLLDQHPDIYMSTAKEHYFFGNETPGDQDDYHSYFPFEQSHTYYGEATPSYHTSAEIAREIREYCPKAKILAIVRDPIQRLHSQYYFHKQTGIIAEDVSITEAIFDVDKILLRDSHYEKTLPVYQDLFGANQVKILSLEKGKSDLNNLWKELLEFLELTPAPTPTTQSEPENPTGSKSFRWLYRRTILPVKMNHPRAYRSLLQMKFLYWTKNFLLKLLGTADKDVLPEETIERLKKEFAPTYKYLSSQGFGDIYNEY